MHATPKNPSRSSRGSGRAALDAWLERADELLAEGGGDRRGDGTARAAETPETAVA